MCGIFAYLNFLTEKKRSYILETLLNGLSRLEYRGYDSAGLAIDGDITPILIIKQVGKVNALRKMVQEHPERSTFENSLLSHCGMAHTRWATHGPPCQVNSHPHRSDVNSEFCVVHNGIITNYKELKTLLEKKGYRFESETDTEVVAKLTRYIYEEHQRKLSFHDLVKLVITELEGAFAFIFKSVHFPNEIIATRRGSPLVIGVKTDRKLKMDFVDVQYAVDVELGITFIP